jgi:hypothetical protein
MRNGSKATEHVSMSRCAMIDAATRQPLQARQLDLAVARMGTPMRPGAERLA